MIELLQLAGLKKEMEDVALRLLVFTLAIILLDQFSKIMVQQFMHPRQSIVLIQNFLSFTYLENPGAAFGIFPHRTMLFIIITVAVILFIIYYFRNLPHQYFFMRLGLVLQLAGAVGNLVDRIRLGHVIDFINLSFWPPVFNVADVAIAVGIIVFVYSFWKKEITLQEEI